MPKETLLLKKLIQKRLTLSIAESCTGGLLSHRITNLSGSSKVFLLGTVTYTNESKNKILHVPKQLMKTQGAVSAGVAKAMAKGIRALTHASLGIGITGIAGPTGGSPEKPVGTVFIGLSSVKKGIVRRFHLKGNRLEIKRKACNKAIQMLCDFIR